jgi:hypothetical protein
MTTPIQTIQTILAENAADSVLLQAYASAVAETPLIDLSSITFPGDDEHVVLDLKTDQASALAAVAQASAPLGKWQTSLSDIIGFYNLWQSRYQQLNTLLNDLSTGTNKTDFLNGLQGLVSECNQMGKGTADLTFALNDFVAALANPLSRLRSDLVIVEKTVGGSGTLATLQSEIDSLNSTMQQDNDTISRGATKQAVGVLIILVVVLAKIAKSSGQQGGQGQGQSQGGAPDDGSGKIIKASIVIIEDDIQQQSDALTRWKASFTQYQTLLTNLALDKLLYAAVNQLCDSLDSLSQAATSMNAYETQLQTAWNAVASALEALMAEVFPDSFTNTSGVAATLLSMSDQLLALKNSALTLQQTGTVQVVNS